jgi:hypothetical protein
MEYRWNIFPAPFHYMNDLYQLYHLIVGSRGAYQKDRAVGATAVLRLIFFLRFPLIYFKDGI